MDSCNKTFTILLVIILAMPLIILPPAVKAQYQGDIAINANGVINPYTSSLQLKDNIYVLTSDINGTITINTDNVILDGNGHTITVPSIFSAGITLNDVSNCVVANFTIEGGQYGINVYGTHNVIDNNTVSRVDNGIYSLDEPTGAIILLGSENTIIGNNIKNSLVGINFSGDSPGNNCSNNLIAQNIVSDCSTALLTYDSSNNKIYHNNFIDNSIIFEDGTYSGYATATLNIWDDGYPSGGNYWSDYSTRYRNAIEIDSSGIGNTSYFVRPNGFVDQINISAEARNYWNKVNAIELNNTDHYPLMSPYNYTLYLFRTTQPKIAFLYKQNQTFTSNNLTLNFTVNKPTSWIGYSLDGQQNVTVSGNFTIANMTNSLHDIAVYANDTFGNMGVQTANFTVDQPTPASTIFPIAAKTLPIIATVALLVIFVVSMLLYRRHRKTSKLGQGNSPK